jgi:hypothetical protein
MLMVFFMYVEASQRFSDAEIRAYVVANPGARIDLGNAVRTDPREVIRLLYALNFPAILAAAAASSVLHAGPVQVGSSYTLGLYDIWYFLCVCILWYLVGLLVEAKLRMTSSPLLWIPQIVMGLKLLGLTFTLVVGIAAVIQLAAESLIVKGQEVTIAAVVWSLILVIYLVVSLRPHFSARKHPPSLEVS